MFNKDKIKVLRIKLVNGFLNLCYVLFVLYFTNNCISKNEQKEIPPTIKKFIETAPKEGIYFDELKNKRLDLKCQSAGEDSLRCDFLVRHYDYQNSYLNDDLLKELSNNGQLEFRRSYSCIGTKVDPIFINNQAVPRPIIKWAEIICAGDDLKKTKRKLKKLLKSGERSCAYKEVLGTAIKFKVEQEVFTSKVAKVDQCTYKLTLNPPAGWSEIKLNYDCGPYQSSAYFKFTKLDLNAAGKEPPCADLKKP